MCVVSLQRPYLVAEVAGESETKYKNGMGLSIAELPACGLTTVRDAEPAFPGLGRRLPRPTVESSMGISFRSYFAALLVALTFVSVVLSGCGSDSDIVYVGSNDGIVELRVEESSLEPEGQTSAFLEVREQDARGLDVSWEIDGDFSVEPDNEDPFAATVFAPAELEASATLRATLSDEDGVRDVATFRVRTRSNQAPRIRSAIALPQVIAPGESFDLLADAVDPEGDELLYTWLAPAGWSLDTTVGASITATAPDAYSSAGRISLTVTDAHGAADETAVVVSTVQNPGPSITSLFTTRPVADPDELTTLEAIAAHPIEADLEYEWEADGGFTVITDGRPASSPQLQAPDIEGAVGTVRLTVTDSSGASAQSAVVVQTRHYLEPIIDTITAYSPLEVGDSAFLSVWARDPEGGELTYRWFVSNPNLFIAIDDVARIEVLGSDPGDQVPFTVSVTNEVGKTVQAVAYINYPEL